MARVTAETMTDDLRSIRKDMDALTARLGNIADRASAVASAPAPGRYSDQMNENSEQCRG